MARRNLVRWAVSNLFSVGGEKQKIRYVGAKSRPLSPLLCTKQKGIRDACCCSRMPFAISGALAYHFVSAYDLHTVRFCIGAATGEVVSRLCSTGLGRLHRSDA